MLRENNTQGPKLNGVERLFLDGRNQFRCQRFYAWGVVSDQLSLFVDQEFIEIPTHGGIQGAIFCFIAEPAV